MQQPACSAECDVRNVSMLHSVTDMVGLLRIESEGIAVSV